jgi:hypothetical protein
MSDIISPDRPGIPKTRDSRWLFRLQSLEGSRMSGLSSLSDDADFEYHRAELLVRFVW